MGNNVCALVFVLTCVETLRFYLMVGETAAHGELHDDASLTLGVDGRLASELLQHLRRASEPVTRLSNGAVQHQLVDLEVPHRVGLGLRLETNHTDVATCGAQRETILTEVQM